MSFKFDNEILYSRKHPQHTVYTGCSKTKVLQFLHFLKKMIVDPASHAFVLFIGQACPWCGRSVNVFISL